MEPKRGLKQSKYRWAKTEGPSISDVLSRSDLLAVLRATQRGLALGLAHATPNAIRLADGKRMGAALLENGARKANCLGAVLAVGAGAATLTVGVVKNIGRLAAARSVKLPVPEVRIRSRKLVGHRHRGHCVEVSVVGKVEHFPRALGSPRGTEKAVCNVMMNNGFLPGFPQLDMSF